MNEREAYDIREELFIALSEGRMTPEQAEANAAEFGLEPLAVASDPARYNPMTKSYWTLAMALGWIVWRTADGVREFLPEWRHDHCHWYFHEHRVANGSDGIAMKAVWSWEPVYKSRSPISDMPFEVEAQALIGCEGQPSKLGPRMTALEARRDLWEKLGAGKFQASTVLDGRPHLIPANEWPFLQLIQHRGRDILRAGELFGPGLTYNADEILLPREKVEQEWPAPTPTAAAYKRAEAELRQAAESARNGTDPWPKSGEWRDKAREKFGITGRQATDVWRAVASDFPELSSPKGKPKKRR